jgi:hypothetical protein
MPTMTAKIGPAVARWPAHRPGRADFSHPVLPVEDSPGYAGLRGPEPDYAFDCDTLGGKRAGKTKADIFGEEQRALKSFQPGLFDELPES